MEDQSVNEEKPSSGVASERAGATPDLVSSLSDRELDALVAERWMGWTRFPEAMHPTDNRTIGDVLYCPPDCPWNIGAMNVVPHFSTEIAAAMVVLDRFEEWTAFKLGKNSLAGSYEVQVTHDNKVFMATGDTLPEAICYAAIQAAASASPQHSNDAV